MPERQVRFTEELFDRLDTLLPGERGLDGTPSVTDFLLFDLPTVRDRRAADFEHNRADIVEAFWLAVDLGRDDDLD